MALVSRIRRFSLVLVALGALVAPALAGERMSPGCTDDCQAKARSTSSIDGSSPAGTPAARAPRTSINPADDVYAPKPKPGVTSPAPHSPEISPTQGAARTSAPETPARERKRESATSVGRAQRQAPARVKVSIRNLPATPGMGTLLRVGVSAGREMSLLDFTIPNPPQRDHSGRAPPRGPTLANFAPAALPGAPPSAAPLRVCPPSRGTATQHPTTTTVQDEPLASEHAPRAFPAAAFALAAQPTRSTTERGPRAGSGAGRPESAPPRDSSRLSGGLAT